MSSDAELIRYELKKSGLSFDHLVTDTEEGFLSALASFKPDVILSDHSMPQFNSTTALKLLRERDSHLPFILVTGNVSEEFAVDIVKNGADDYILKSSLKRLPSAITNALAARQHERERNYALEAMANSEKHFRSLIENIGDIILIVDPWLNVSYASPSIETVLGYKQNDVIGSNAFEIVHPDDQKLPISIFEFLRNNWNTGNHKEFRVRNAAGEYRIIETVTKGYFDHNENISFIVNGRDITERKTFQRKLESKVDELDTFIYRSSHDLKGPLSSLDGLLQIAQKELTDTHTQEYLKMMKQSTGKLHAILHGLIEVTNITRGSIVFDSIDVDTEINEVINSFNGSIIKNNVKINTAIQLPHGFHSNKQLFNSILKNLLSNSIAYRNKLQTETLINIKAIQQKGHALFEIEDNGIGIPAQLQGNVFNLFFKACHESTGSGLGLYIVKECVEKLNGNVELKSEQGNGTSITFKIPNPAPAK